MTPAAKRKTAVSPRRALMRGLASLTETIRFVVVVCLGCALTVGIAYGLTRYVVRHAAASPQERVELLDRSARMRALSNELVGLASEFINQSQPALLTGANDFDQWRAASFLPRLDDYRRRVIAEAGPLPELAPLLEAADTLAAQAKRDAADREAVAVAVLEAATSVELVIGELGVSRYLGEPPRTLGAVAAP